MYNLEEFKNQLSEEQKSNLIIHFNEIYELEELTEHELKISYLAYLWKNKQVVLIDEMGYDVLNSKSLGIDVHIDYEISFEAGEGGEGGVNLAIMYEFYYFDILMTLI